MRTVKQIVSDYRERLASFSDDYTLQADDDDAELLIRLDDAATKLVSSLGLIAKIEMGSEKFAEKVLIDEAVHTLSDMIDEVAAYVPLYANQNDGERFKATARHNLSLVDLPAVDALAATSVDRMLDELDRSIINVETLMASGEIKKVIRATQAIATKARRITKTQVQGEMYQSKHPLFRVLVGKVLVQPLIDIFKQFDDWRDRNQAFHDDVLPLLIGQAA